jgi:hypothetical protein
MSHDREGACTMIALGIASTWLTLTAGGFVGLSALGRAGAREDVHADLGSLEDRVGGDWSLVRPDTGRTDTGSTLSQRALWR